ncbi:MAG TPA: hypothetical protein PLN33_08340 [Hyphomonadaceae bacterium]|nr:hypothetical protein [Hyphomonadaceae bacterium]HPN04722.1 hypothetical protein [Hyphomonadaceae bacterium]
MDGFKSAPVSASHARRAYRSALLNAELSWRDRQTLFGPDRGVLRKSGKP